MPLPAVLTIQSGINQLRYATLKGIMAAKKKEIRKAAPCPRAPRRKQKIVSLYVPEKGKKTQMIGGSPAEAAKELVRALREEARVICMILVIAEQRDGKLNRATLGDDRRRAAACARDRRADHRRWCPAPTSAGVAAELAAAQVAGGRHASSTPRSSRTRPTGSRPRCRTRSAQLSPALVLLPHTYQTRDFAPKLAARLDRALVTDVTGVKTRAAASRRSCGRCSRAS